MRKQQIIDPKLLRKASRREVIDPLPEVAETSTPIDIKYQVSVDTKGFEVRDLLLAPGCATPEYFHEKKTRMYIVIAGEGLITSRSGGEAEGTVEGLENKPLTAGSFFVCTPGTKYQLCSTAESSLQVLVIQDSKYAANLTETAPAIISELGAQLDIIRQAAVSRPESRRNKSKAIQQQLEIAASRGKLGVSVTPSGLPPGFVPEGINANPTMVFNE